MLTALAIGLIAFGITYTTAGTQGTWRATAGYLAGFAVSFAAAIALWVSLQIAFDLAPKQVEGIIGFGFAGAVGGAIAGLSVARLSKRPAKPRVVTSRFGAHWYDHALIGFFGGVLLAGAIVEAVGRGTLSQQTVSTLAIACIAAAWIASSFIFKK